MAGKTYFEVPLELPPTPLEELPRPELEPDPEVPGADELGLDDVPVLGLLELLLPALDPELCCDSQSVFAMPVSPVHWLEDPALELSLGDVVLLLDPVLGALVLGLAVLGLVALPEEPLPIEPLELPEVCATETPAAPRNAAATAAQRSLLVIFAP